jgi:hypothetical protein
MFPHSSFLTRIASSTRLILTAAAFSVAVLAAANAPRQVTIAIVKDGPSWLLDDVATGFRQEAQTLTAGRAVLTFKDSAPFDAGWREGAAEQSLDAALGDPSIDYVLALGVRTATAAAAPGRVLSKPVLGAVVQETDLAPLPIGAGGRSTKPNFAVVTLPSRASEQLADLRGVSRFASLHVLIDDGFAPNRAALEPWREQLARSLNTPVTLVRLGASADETLRALGDQPGTVFLFPAIRMDETNRAALLRELSARKFTVLSYLGQPDVEGGALAGVMPTSGPALARRLAINLDQMIAGTPSVELPLQVILPR